MFFQKYFSVLPDRMKTLNAFIYFLLLKINVIFEIQGYEIVSKHFVKIYTHKSNLKLWFLIKTHLKLKKFKNSMHKSKKVMNNIYSIEHCVI